MSDTASPNDTDPPSDTAPSNDTAFTVESARKAAADGDLTRWVREFLASDGSDNAELAEILTERERWWIGPVELPIRALHRLAGPPGDPVLSPIADESWWRDDVAEMADRIEDEGWEPPPVVVTYQDGRLALEDGNHRVEGLRQTGAEQAWAVVGFDREPDRDAFIASVEA